ncbi:AMP nucleosidase [Klebsiella pneumoniae]|nr:AMP nucleosidase [Klebsiella pneumoniae]
MNIKAASLTPEQALAELEARYEASVTALRKAIGDYIDHNTLPDTEARAEGLFVYPQLSVSWDGADHKALKTRAWGRFTMPVAIPPPLRIRNCSATICWNS